MMRAWLNAEILRFAQDASAVEVAWNAEGSGWLKSFRDEAQRAAPLHNPADCDTGEFAMCD